MGIKKWARPPPGHDDFFRPLKQILKPKDFERVEFAYLVSKYGHARQVRDDGTRYFDHPKAAAWIYIDELGGKDPRAIVDLLLHDISEDAYLISSFRIKRNFGIASALDVEAVTKLPKGKETTKEYLERVIGRGAYAILAKLCDRLHNLRSLGSCTKEKRKKQIAETREYHLPMLVPALREKGRIWAKYANYLEEKILEAIAIQEK